MNAPSSSRRPPYVTRDFRCACSGSRSRIDALRQPAAEDAPFLDEIYEFERENQRFTFVPTMTRMSDSSASWTGETGRIDPGMTLRHTRRSASHENAIYYIAGPPQMVAGLHAVVSSLGIDDDDIRMEDFAGY
jgi:Na+-transporting NADH:ubiquinone oxidoreductase subunit NqrF